MIYRFLQRWIIRPILQPFLTEVYTHMDDATAILNAKLETVKASVAETNLRLDQITTDITGLKQWIADHEGGATAEEIAALGVTIDEIVTSAGEVAAKAANVDALVPDATEEPTGEPTEEPTPEG